MSCPNIAFFPIVNFGALKAGATVVEEHPTVATASGDTAVVLYTSGTTGRPKGAELSHENMVLNAIVADDLVARTGRDAFLVSLPLFHSFGQSVLMNMGLRRGATLVGHGLPGSPTWTIFNLLTF